MLLSLPLALALARLPAESVPIFPLKGGLTVDARVGGIGGRFFLATTVPATYLSPEFLKKLPPDDSGRAEVVIGSTRLAPAIPVEADVAASFPGIDGILGAECLKDAAIGIDSVGAQLRIWPGGAPKSEAQAWINEVVPRAKVGWLPVDVASGGALVKMRIGGKSGTFGFDATSTKPEVRRSLLSSAEIERIAVSESRAFTEATTYPVDVVAANGLQIGETVPLWSVVRRKRDDEPTSSGADGTITPRGLLSRRLVLDYANARLGYDVPTLDEAIGRSLSQLTSLEIRVDGDRLVFVRPLSGPPDAMRRLLVGGELVEYEKLSAAEILAAMRAGGERRLRVLAVVARAYDDGIRGKVLLNGKVRALEVTASPQQ